MNCHSPHKHSTYSYLCLNEFLNFDEFICYVVEFYQHVWLNVSAIFPFPNNQTTLEPWECHLYHSSENEWYAREKDARAQGLGTRGPCMDRWVKLFNCKLLLSIQPVFSEYYCFKHGTFASSHERASFWIIHISTNRNLAIIWTIYRGCEL